MTPSGPRILIAEDEKGIILTLCDDLEDAGFRPVACEDGAEALRMLEQERFDALVTDINLPGLRGDELLRRIKTDQPDLPVILITGFGTIESAVRCMKDGAADYILKPFRNEQVITALERVARLKELESENRNLREQIEELSPFEKIIGQSAAMREVFEITRTVSRTSSSVLITGETGTGKELFARAIHNRSPRAKGPFVALSCAAIPSTLLEDELFGHERGAYTDARERKIGRIERAAGGTFFLDDIDDMPLETQVKLLRVLQEREVERLGGEETFAVDIRVITATKVDLREMVRERTFREDLYYRLNVVPLRLPPLRERKGDVPLLVAHFLRRYAEDRDLQIRDEDLEAMELYSWPGNVRELEHAVERAVALAGRARYLKREHLIERNPVHKMAPLVPQRVQTLREVVEAAEREHIERILELTGHHKAECARQLGISRKNLWEKMKLHGIES